MRKRVTRTIPLTERLPLYFIMVGLSSILIVGLVTFFSARSALLSRTFDQLISVRIEKEKRLNNFVHDCITGMELLSSSSEYNSLYSIFDSSPEMHKAQSDDFIRFYTRLFEINTLYEEIYIIHKKELIHINIHNDSCCVALKALNTYKDTFSSIEFCNNFDIKNHNFTVKEHPKGLYLASHSKVNDKNDSIKTIVFLNQEYINNIMLENNLHSGLGHSGEAYLVGEDYKLRSESRFIPNSVRKTTSKTIGVLEALDNISDEKIIKDYRDISVLSSYSHINVGDLNWVILAEIDEKEAMISVYKLRNQIVVSSLIISFILLIISYSLSKRLIQPIIELSRGAKKVAKGNFDQKIHIHSNDEIGELTESFNHMVDELKSKTEALKADKLKQLRSMIDGQEMERNRVSRELHDGLGQNLFAIKMNLEKIISSKNHEEEIHTVYSQFDIIIDDVRRLSNDLKPSALESFGIVKALNQLCMNYESQGDKNFMFEIEETELQLSKRTQTYLYRIIQEGLNNAWKHSLAENINLNYFYENGDINISIEDDGMGMNIKNALEKNGSGLTNLYERVNLLQGKMDIKSESGRGTIITIQIPIKCK